MHLGKILNVLASQLVMRDSYVIECSQMLLNRLGNSQWSRKVSLTVLWGEKIPWKASSSRVSLDQSVLVA